MHSTKFKSLSVAVTKISVPRLRSIIKRDVQRESKQRLLHRCILETVTHHIPPLNLAHYCGRVPNLMPDLKPMTLSFLDFSPEARNQVYELLVVEEVKFSRAGFPNRHVPEDGMYDLASDSPCDDDDDDDDDDSDIEMEDAPISNEEAMDLEEYANFLTGHTVPPLDKLPDPDLDRHQCERVGGVFSTDFALPFMWACKRTFHHSSVPSGLYMCRC